jgi:hypothetical protein
VSRRLRAWNWAAGLGPVAALAGVLSYFTLFYRWPALRDTPWANYALLALGLALSVRGLRRAWSRGLARRLLATGGLVLSIGFAALFGWYVGLESADLPDPARGLPLGAPLPSLTLLDERGGSVELARLDQPLVLVFYRGFW